MTDRHTTNTTPALTPEREAEIRARLGAAWRGPWAVQGCPGAAFLEIGTPNGPIAQVSVHLKHDAEFIADARQAVPELLAELDRVRAKLDKERGRFEACAREASDAAQALDRVRAERDALRKRVAELETFGQGCDAEGCVLPHSSWCERAQKHAAENDGCTCPKPWKGSPQPHAGYCWLLSPPRDEVERLTKANLEAANQAQQVIDGLRARVAELEQQAAEGVAR